MGVHNRMGCSQKGCGSVNWMEQSEYAVAEAVCFCMGLDPESKKAYDFIRYTYRDDGSRPQPARTKDVCYITTSILQTPGVVERKLNGETISIETTIPMEFLLTFYGPNAAANAERTRMLLVIDTGYGCPLDTFRSNNLSLSVPIQPSVYAPEQEDGNWRKRADLKITLTYLERIETGAKTVTTPPTISLEI